MIEIGIIGVGMLILAGAAIGLCLTIIFDM